MYELNQVLAGIQKFIERDFIARLEDPLKQVLLGGATAIYLQKGTKFIDTIKNIPMIKLLGVIDENNNVDIDLLYSEFKPRIRKTPITLEVPYIGNVTLKEIDIEHLYKYIQEK